MPYPVTSGLCNIFTDLLRRQTERTDLGRKRGRSTNLTTGGTEVDDLLLVGVEFGSWRWARLNQHMRVGVSAIARLQPSREEAILTHG